MLCVPGMWPDSVGSGGMSRGSVVRELQYVEPGVGGHPGVGSWGRISNENQADHPTNLSERVRQRGKIQV